MQIGFFDLGLDHLNVNSFPLVRWRLAQLASHLVVALIALVVIGGATRVMEAGLACPDWPLCYGALLPGQQMNLQVFLEWFHRVDAFFVGTVLMVQFVLALIFKSKLPNWLTWFYGFLLILVGIQAALGALTVLNLLPSGIVTTHLVLALFLVALMSWVSQRLREPNRINSPVWWRIMGFGSISMVITQALIGGRMATTWSSKKCLIQGDSCQLFDLHRFFAMPVGLFIMIFVFISIFVGGWTRTQWPFLLFISILVSLQILLGIASVRFQLLEPSITVSHQLIATLLVASLASLSARRPNLQEKSTEGMINQPVLEVCHG